MYNLENMKQLVNAYADELGTTRTAEEKFKAELAEFVATVQKFIKLAELQELRLGSDNGIFFKNDQYSYSGVINRPVLNELYDRFSDIVDQHTKRLIAIRESL